MSEPLLVGFDFGGTKLAIVLADPDGTTVAVEVIATEAERGAKQAVQRATRTAREMLAEREAVAVAVGVATMGITHDDHVQLAPNVPGWERLSLPALLHDAFGATPIAIANDVKAAALAELTWGELRDVRTGIYLNLGTGLAAALVVHGEVLDGAHGAAGEIGYWARSRADCAGAAAGHAPLEEYAGGAGVLARARAELGLDGGVAALLDADDPDARAFLDDLYAEIALHTANLAVALDPERVVVGGGYARNSDAVLDAIRARLDAFVPYPPELRRARFGADAGTAGAVALARGALEPG
ncbi:MAG TPA: ROK family protein [Jatrophihabitans sp.]|nr:ROK family protein [Jatrophihabitans sp.]